MDYDRNSEKILENLKERKGVLRMVLDTDTYNEVDDQFALVYALCSPERLKVEAVYAAPFQNQRADNAKQGMEMSYDEIVRLLGKMNISHEGFAFKGSDRFMKNNEDAVQSDAVTDLINRAMSSKSEEPLYVVAIGAITNVASAILKEPKIKEKIVVVWLGGHIHSWDDTNEFNLAGDLKASQVIFDSQVPFVQIPCNGVASHLLATVPELEEYLSGKNEVCNTLVELFKEYETDHFGWAKEIWDISAIAYMINPEWAPANIVHAPILTDSKTYSFDNRRHFMKVVTWLNRNAIFKDMYSKIINA